jgi:hypothetical protein
LKSTTHIYHLFAQSPEQWGLRGDPPLWDAMAAHLADAPLPISRAGVKETLEAAFLELTGHVITTDEPIHVERFATGGMSSGMVSAAFWRDTAIPLLVSRFVGNAPATRDYFAEPYIAGILGDASWAVYFPKRDVGFDFIISKATGDTTLIRAVQVKGLYPTKEKKDKTVYGFTGKLSATNPDMVLALPYFSANGRGEAPDHIAFMPMSRIAKTATGYRCEPARLHGGMITPRKTYERYFDEPGLAALEDPLWSQAAVPNSPIDDEG